MSKSQTSSLPFHSLLPLHLSPPPPVLLLNSSSLGSQSCRCVWAYWNGIRNDVRKEGRLSPLQGAILKTGISKSKGSKHKHRILQAILILTARFGLPIHPFNKYVLRPSLSVRPSVCSRKRPKI